MPLKNYHDMPPGGFMFFQPETGWSAPQWLSWNQLRDAIIQMRTANPRFGLSLDPARVEWEMDTQNTARLQAMPGTSHFLLSDASGSTSPPVFTKPQRRAVAVVANVKSKATGIGVIIEMFGGSAEPVAGSLSEKRASICSTCPNNVQGNLLQRFTQEVVKGIQSTLSVVKEMELKTSVDDKLGTCSICLCPLKFKCHVAMDVIVEKTTPETMKAFPDFCWIKNADKF